MELATHDNDSQSIRFNIKSRWHFRPEFLKFYFDSFYLLDKTCFEKASFFQGKEQTI